MKITQVTTSYKVTCNLGDFSSVSADISLTADVGEFDAPSEVARMLWEEAKDQIGRQIVPSLKTNQVTLRELFQGKPVLGGRT